MCVSDLQCVYMHVTVGIRINKLISLISPGKISLAEHRLHCQTHNQVAVCAGLNIIDGGSITVMEKCDPCPAACVPAT